MGTQAEELNGLGGPYAGLTDTELVERDRWKLDVWRRVYKRAKEVRNVTFSCYRRGDISATHTASQRVAPDEVQFDGVIFYDGTVVIRWNTLAHSTAVFPSLDDLLEIHGHPEYDSEFRFEGEE